MEVLSKTEALQKNLKYYFTGIPCKNNHISKRYINTGICYECKKINMKKDYIKHTDRVKSINKKKC